jgi:hypothetical protein
LVNITRFGQLTSPRAPIHFLIESNQRRKNRIKTKTCVWVLGWSIPMLLDSGPTFRLNTGRDSTEAVHGIVRRIHDTAAAKS